MHPYHQGPNYNKVLGGTAAVWRNAFKVAGRWSGDRRAPAGFPTAKPLSTLTSNMTQMSTIPTSMRMGIRRGILERLANVWVAQLEIATAGSVFCLSFKTENFSSIRPTALFNSLRERRISKNAAWAKIVG